jgi:hypothetical protein
MPKGKPPVTRDLIDALQGWASRRDADLLMGRRERSFQYRMNVDDELRAHVRGGEWTNATRTERSALAFTSDDVAEVRDLLESAHGRIRLADVEDLVAQTLAGVLRVPDNTAAQRKRAQRERARAAGRCIVNPAHVAAAGRAVCDACNAAAHARQRGEAHADPHVADDWNPADVF